MLLNDADKMLAIDSELVSGYWNDLLKHAFTGDVRETKLTNDSLEADVLQDRKNQISNND